MLTIDRKDSLLRVLDGDREVWSGRIGAEPPEHIRYQEGHLNMAIPIDHSSPEQIIHAVRQQQNSK